MTFKRTTYERFLDKHQRMHMYPSSHPSTSTSAAAVYQQNKKIHQQYSRQSFYTTRKKMTSLKLNHLSLLLLLGVLLTSQAWVSPPRTTLSRQNVVAPSPSKLNGIFDFMSPFESKIPEELRDEIYQAEANTPAAKDRGQRVAIYALIAFVGIL